MSLTKVTLLLVDFQAKFAYGYIFQKYSLLSMDYSYLYLAGRQEPYKTLPAHLLIVEKQGWQKNLKKQEAPGS